MFVYVECELSLRNSEMHHSLLDNRVAFSSHVEPTCQSRRRKRLGFQSLGWKDPLEEDMATHSSILAWRILWTDGRWQAIVHKGTKHWTWPKQLSTQGCGTRLEMWKVRKEHKTVVNSDQEEVILEVRGAGPRAKPWRREMSTDQQRERTQTMRREDCRSIRWD